MDLKLFVVLFSAIALTSAGHGGGKKKGKGKNKAAKAHWDYEAHGPQEWYGKCKGQRQSPIDIKMADLEAGKDENRISSHNFWAEAKGSYTLKNNGHALQIDLPSDTPYKLTKAGQTYIPLQAHMHFDPLSGEGSEHTVNGKKYLAEIHIVHRNSKYSKKKDIMGNEDGLLVVGIFVSKIKGIGNIKGDLDFAFNPKKIRKMVFGNRHNSFALQAFSAAIKLQPGEKKDIPAFPLAYLLPKVKTGRSVSYVNYKGSLTTPPCSEIVDWIVITGQTLEISDDLATAFEDVVNSNATPMSGNNRPVQPINTRLVYGVKGML